MGINDGGFTVAFDGKINTVMRSGLIKDYPIGGMIAEYCRLHPTEIKDVLLQYKDLDVTATTDALAEFLLWFDDKTRDKFGLVTSALILCDFVNIIYDLTRRTEEQMIEYCNRLNSDSKEIKDFIFADTQWNDFGRETVGQALLTAYFDYASYYAVERTLFDVLVSDTEINEDRVDGMLSLFAENIEMQHIEYHISIIEGKFCSLYTFNSATSLILFEIANVINYGIKFVKCPICGNYFVPEGRSDTLYCNYPSPQNPAKTCKEIGAQVTRANKEKNDVLTREYRKLYMRLKMASNRHPGVKRYYKPLNDLTEGNKEWKKKLSDGISTVEEYLSWLQTFK